jgi:hypothetical protein
MITIQSLITVLLYMNKYDELTDITILYHSDIIITNVQEHSSRTIKFQHHTVRSTCFCTLHCLLLWDIWLKANNINFHSASPTSSPVSKEVGSIFKSLWQCTAAVLNLLVHLCIQTQSLVPRPHKKTRSNKNISKETQWSTLLQP